MKIVMTSDTFFPRVGGAEIHVFNIAKRLCEAGHEVTLIECEPRAGAPAKDLLPGVRVMYIPWKKSNILRLFRETWRAARGVDVIHAHYSYRLAVIAGIVGKIRRVPVIVTLHGTGTLDIPGARFFHRKLHDQYRYWSLRLASLVISTSEDLANIARRAAPGITMTVIPNGFDERLFTPGTPPVTLATQYANKKVVLTVRRLVPKNGVQYLVEALPYIVRRVPNVVHLAAGDGRLQDGMRERAKILGVEQHIVFLGMLNNVLVPDYLRLANVAVFPSTAESSSIACAEAMATGTPIVASKVGGLIELIGAGEGRGTFVKLVDWEESDYGAPETLPQERYEALGNAVADALLAPDTAKTMAAELYARESLGWDVIAKRTEEAYIRVLDDVR